MKIYDMFEKKITRDIKGVIKVDQKGRRSYDHVASQ